MLIPIQDIDYFNPHIFFVVHAIADKERIYTSEYHAHDFVEFSIITSGAIHYHIEGEDYLVEQGDIMLFNPGTYHQSTTLPGTVCTELHIGVGNLKIHQGKANYIKTPRDKPILHSYKYKTEIWQCIQSIEKEQRIRQLGYSFMLKAKVMELIALLYREMDEAFIEESIELTQAGSRDKKKIVQQLIDYMNQSYMEDISLEEMSKTMYLSPVYISKIFKEETGTSPINYLIQIRLQKAKDILEQEVIPIQEVASRVGYTDAYYFSKLFKKYYGMSPSHYIKQLKVGKS